MLMKPFLVCIAFSIILIYTMWHRSMGASPVPFYHLNFLNSTYFYPLETLPSNDYHKLINISNFSFVNPLPSFSNCSLLLLVLVHSAPRNVALRQTIRNTWGQKRPHMKLFFLMGLVNDGDPISFEVEEEKKKFGDIVQGTFVDDYKNMTYKHVMLFKYAIYHWKQAKYILKTDDDVFVNMALMMHFLFIELSPLGTSETVLCSVATNAPVARSYRSKWRTPFKEYAYRTYPDYCLGWAILYSKDALFQLYKEAQKASFLWIDDVHITGIILSRINLTLIDIKNVVLKKRSMDVLTDDKIFLFGPEDIQTKDIEKLWLNTKNRDNHISILSKIKLSKI